MTITYCVGYCREETPGRVTSVLFRYEIEHNWSLLPKAHSNKRPLAIFSEAVIDAASNNKQKRKILPFPVTTEG